MRFRDAGIQAVGTACVDLRQREMDQAKNREVVARSSRRKEARSEIRNPKSEIRNSQSLLTSAATVQGNESGALPMGKLPLQHERSLLPSRLLNRKTGLLWPEFVN